MANPETPGKEEVEAGDGFVEDVDDTDDAEGDAKLACLNDVLKDPTMLAAMQAKIRSEDHAAAHAVFMQSLPSSVKRRIHALKKLQLASAKVEADFYKEVHTLEVKYLELYKDQYEKRAKIVNSEYEPNDDECEWPSDDEEENAKSEADQAKDKSKSEAKAEGDAGADIKGIPDFWLTIFKNVEMLSEMVQEHDEPVLKHLSDIKVKLTQEPMGFELEFFFTPNEYFNNSVLTKKYEFKCEPDQDDPFSFEGPEIVRCHGCKIDWKKDKNVTVRIVKKKQKHKGHGGVRVVPKTVPNDSFFNFFDPPVLKEDEEEQDEDLQQILTADFELGHFIRERIVPRAILYYTGEALDEDEDDDFEDEDDEDEDDEDGEDEDDEPPVTSRSKRRH
ncbi:unnamed protein product [Notodromas monacha]|uniref:Nucleosome assembly protein 1-like 1 n=1 Tax=Notodromas monacha TaxID=399045 RepID=A0A7R9BWI0_9CRUS|nr:unnamed protein product [Notodromas monacha]CAG0923082.1 unnamed protein product [Notodromas monacha]